MKNPQLFRGGQGENYRIVNDDLVIDDRQEYCCALAIGQVDFRGLDAGRQRQLLGAFTQTCETFEESLQILMRVRRDSPTDKSDAGSLDRHLAEFLQQRDYASPQYSRQLFLVLGGCRADVLLERRQSLATQIAGGGVSATPLQANDLSHIWRDSCDSWNLTPRHLHNKTQWAQGIAIGRFPGHSLRTGWLAPLLTLNVDADISIVARRVSLGDALTTLRKRVRDHSSRQLIEMQRELMADPFTEVALDNVLELREGLAANRTKPLTLSIVATARGETREESDAACSSLDDAIRATGCHSERTFLRHHLAMATTAPSATDHLGVGKLSTTSVLATCVPWVNSTIRDKDGYHLGFDTTSLTTVSVNPFDQSQYSNANVGVFASSGQGKSFVLSSLVIEAKRHGVEAIIIDPEGEYRPITKALGGRYLMLGDSSELSLNVLDIAVHHGDTETTIQTAIGFIGLLCGNAISPIDKAILDEIIRHQIQRQDVSLQDCIPDFKRKLPEIATVVDRLCRGPFGATFCSTSQVTKNPALLAIGMRNLPDELIAPATLVVANWIWQTVVADPRPRHVIFDEVGALCVHPPLRGLLVQLARRCRKYRASLVVATQNIGDLLNTDEGNVVATNCATVLLGGHRSAETKRMETAFGLNEEQRQFIETAPRGRFLLLAGNRRLPIDVSVPNAYRQIMSGTHE